jgi:hypothetical protein
MARGARMIVPILVILVGLAFVALGVVKPPEVWDTDKVRLGREWLGETGMVVFCGTFGGLFALFGGLLLAKR